MTNVVPLHLQVVLPLPLRQRIDRLAERTIRSRDDILLRVIEAGLPEIEACPPSLISATPTPTLTTIELNDPPHGAA
jgi:hypothetical protein